MVNKTTRNKLFFFIQLILIYKERERKVRHAQELDKSSQII